MTLQAGFKWIDTAERNPEKYGTYRVLCKQHGQRTEDDYLWNGTNWVTPRGSLSRGVEAWAENPETAPAEKKETRRELRTVTGTELETAGKLAMYEARIQLYKEQIGTGYIGIGKTLNEAKESGAVPHGQWEEWVTKVTGLTPRQAQRCMQAATEIRDGSALARLEMSKALMLLSSGLDEETREAVAGQAAEEGTTVKALKEEISRIRKAQEAADAENAETVKALKLQLVQESGTAAEIREALSRARTEREQLEQQMKARDAAWKTRMDQEAENAYRRGLQDKDAGMERDIRKEFQDKLDYQKSRARQAEDALRTAREDLKKLQAEAGGKWDEGFRARETEIREKEELIAQLTETVKGAHREAAGIENQHRAELIRKNQEIKELEDELEAAEKREAKRAAELDALRKERMQAGMDAARGIGTQAPGAMDLTAAVRDFIGRAGVLPQMGSLILGMSRKEQDSIRAQVETVAKWVEGARCALGVLQADARIQ